jgi:hypothetical protein
MSRVKLTNVLLTINIALAVVIVLMVARPGEIYSGSGLRVAEQTYARLETRNSDGKVIALASGVRLNDKLILSCAHLFEGNQRVFFEGEKLRIVAFNRKVDLALFKVNTTRHTLPNTIIAGVAVPSRKVFNCSNADENSGTLNHYLITYNDSGKGVFHLDKPVIPGESGSGLFDVRGRLVGISAADMPVTFITDPKNFVNYGIAASPKTIIDFLYLVRDRDCDEYYNEVIVKNWFDRIMWRFY